MRKQIVGVVVGVLAAACGGGNPSAPSPSSTTAGTVAAVRVAAPVDPIEVGKKSQLRATALYSDGSESPITSNITWLSLTPESVTVTDDGIASGVTPGAATIRASFGGQVGTLETDVRGRPVAVTVHVSSFDCIADCDDALNGEGDFVYRVAVDGVDTKDGSVESATYETAGYPGKSGIVRLGPGDQHTIDKSRVFNLRDEPSALISVALFVTEWDTFGADPRMDGLLNAANFTWSADRLWGSAAGRHTLTLGSGGCVVRLVYDVSFVYGG